MSKALKRIEDFKRQVLRELYDQCTPKQRDTFDRIYRCRPDELPAENIEHAIRLCERTLENTNSQQNVSSEGVSGISELRRDFDEKKALHDELVRVREAVRFMNDNEDTSFDVLMPEISRILAVHNDKKAKEFAMTLYMRDEETCARVLMQCRPGSPILETNAHGH